jgi:hypothetical protein
MSDKVSVKYETVGHSEKEKELVVLLVHRYELRELENALHYMEERRANARKQQRKKYEKEGREPPISRGRLPSITLHPFSVEDGIEELTRIQQC